MVLMMIVCYTLMDTLAMMAASMMVTVLWKYGDDDCCFSMFF
jgi:hypothetical protein